jgi:23S rRNA G2069 N7-methylase RlmK/C1962 C5-methylase RlmI
MSRTYCDWAWRNLRLNGVEPRGPHSVLRADCLAFLQAAAERPRRWDVVVCDPPTFSNSKRTRRAFSVEKDQGFLLRACHALLRPGGELYFSTNDRRFRLDEAALPPFEVEDLSEATIPEDFRNRRIHRCWRMTR